MGYGEDSLTPLWEALAVLVRGTPALSRAGGRPFPATASASAGRPTSLWGQARPISPPSKALWSRDGPECTADKQIQGRG